MSDEKTKPDLTRIEDLSEFLHQEDPEVDALLQDNEQEQTAPDLPSIDDLEADENAKDHDFPELPSNDEDTVDFSEFEQETDPLNEEQSDNFDDQDYEVVNSEEPLDEDFQLSQDQSIEEGDFAEELNDNLSGSEDNFSPDEFLDEEQNFSPDELNDESELEQEHEYENEDEDVLLEEDSDSIEPDYDDMEQDLEDIVAEEIIEEDSIGVTPPEEEEEVVETTQEQRIIERERFEDVRNFSENISYGSVQTGGNPPFSLVLKKVKNSHDFESIIEILVEHGLINEQNENVMRSSLEHGSLLLSQLSEYSAIYLAHKLRRFNLEIMVGLSEEVHPSKSYENEERGQISRKNLKQNKMIQEDLIEKDISVEEILVTTSPYLEGLQIRKYIDVLTTSHPLIEGDLEEGESDEINENNIYKALKTRLRFMAHQNGANALVGLNYQIQTLDDGQRQILANANAVIVTDLPKDR